MCRVAPHDKRQNIETETSKTKCEFSVNEKHRFFVVDVVVSFDFLSFRCNLLALHAIFGMQFNDKSLSLSIDCCFLFLVCKYVVLIT